MILKNFDLSKLNQIGQCLLLLFILSSDLYPKIQTKIDYVGHRLEVMTFSRSSHNPWNFDDRPRFRQLQCSTDSYPVNSLPWNKWGSDTNRCVKPPRSLNQLRQRHIRHYEFYWGNDWIPSSPCDRIFNIRQCKYKKCLIPFIANLFM